MCHPEPTVYPKKYAHGFCFAVLCCGYTLTDFPISIRLTSLALWQSNDCPSASKATLMNMDKYFMWIHYERLHNHNKAKHNKTVCIFLGIYCSLVSSKWISRYGDFGKVVSGYWNTPVSSLFYLYLNHHMSKLSIHLILHCYLAVSSLNWKPMGMIIIFFIAVNTHYYRVFSHATSYTIYSLFFPGT